MKSPATMQHERRLRSLVVEGAPGLDDASRDSVRWALTEVQRDVLPIEDLTDVTLVRFYCCTTRDCPKYHRLVLITSTALGHFRAWPNLVCICGLDPRIVALDAVVIS